MSILHNQKINNWCFPRNEKESTQRRKRPLLSTLCLSPASGLKPHAHTGLTQGRQDRKPLLSGRHASGPCTPARFPATPSQQCPQATCTCLLRWVWGATHSPWVPGGRPTKCPSLRTLKFCSCAVGLTCPVCELGARGAVSKVRLTCLQKPL